MKHRKSQIMRSANNLNKELSSILSGLNDEASTLLLDKETDYLIVALRGLISYPSVLFDRLIKNPNALIEHIAISARNLFECYLLVAYIIDDPTRAKEFISQKAKDDIELNEGFLSLTTTNTSDPSMRMIQDRIDYIIKLMDRAELTPSKHWTVSHLALQTNNKVEFDAFFKLYSKYIHPSS